MCQNQRRSATRCPWASAALSGSRPAGDARVRAPARGDRRGDQTPTAGSHSGDVGIIDEDGYLSIVDRTKDMLLYKGYNVFPRELEEHLFPPCPGRPARPWSGGPTRGRRGAAGRLRRPARPTTPGSPWPSVGHQDPVNAQVTAVQAAPRRPSSSTPSRSRPPARCSSASSPPASAPRPDPRSGIRARDAHGSTPHRSVTRAQGAKALSTPRSAGRSCGSGATARRSCRSRPPIGSPVGSRPPAGSRR